MWNNVRQESPLAHTPWLPFPAQGADGAGGVALSLRERRFLQMITLRGQPSNQAFTSAARSALDVDLPLRANTVHDGPDHGVAWMGPDEWLIQSHHPHGKPDLPHRLAEALRGSFSSVVDVSSGYTVIDIEGRRAADVLAKGCALDLHPRVFGSSHCAQTRFFDAAVFLRRAAGGISVTTRRSFAPYVAEMLVDAAWEFV